ncbi:hypothetical protein Poly51_22530 [Rubripirellula tenax]|uniref:Uncharacterized protein n=1 Tax=Rubripirellula tenax TaxID=2528015 RepID=A0A5C6FDG8_9BACT|nr:hypothetical protein Poly51_22530 [Rubripirellula tenax]
MASASEHGSCTRRSERPMNRRYRKDFLDRIRGKDRAENCTPTLIFARRKKFFPKKFSFSAPPTDFVALPW